MMEAPSLAQDMASLSALISETKPCVVWGQMMGTADSYGHGIDGDGMGTAADTTRSPDHPPSHRVVGVVVGSGMLNHPRPALAVLRT